MRASLEDCLRRPHLGNRDRAMVVMLGALTQSDHLTLLEAAEWGLSRDLGPGDLREVWLQGIPYAGFPKALAAMEALEPLLRGQSFDFELMEEAPRRERGLSYFGGIHGSRTDRVLSRLSSLDRGFLELVLHFAYGEVLSRPEVEPRLRELMAVASLCCQGTLPQLHAHAAGARARGASLEEVLEAARTTRLLYPDSVPADVVSGLEGFLGS